MAIVATFSADFTKWNEGLRDAQAKLGPVVIAAKGLQRQLEQSAKSFSGANIKREAEIAAAAVKSVGGAVKLTADEIKRYSTTIESAIEKSRRLGEGISPTLKEAKRDIDAARKGLTDFGTAGTGLKSIFSGIGPAIAGAFAVGSIVAAAKATIDYASNIKDLANRTGFTTKAVQELSFAAGQSGVAFDSIATASFKLQKNLGDNNSGTVGALRKIGLSVEYIKSLRPEDAFTVVAGKLKDVTDQAERTKLGAQLMGKGFQDVSQLINDGLDENIAKAREFGVVLSDEQIGKLDALGDTFTALTTKGRVLIAEVLVPFAPALIAAADAAIGLVGPLRELPAYIEDATKAGMRFSGILKFLEADFLEFQQKTNPFATLAGTFDKEIAKLRTDARELGAAADALDFERAFGKVIEDRIKANATALKGFKAEIKDTATTTAGFSAEIAEAQKQLRDFGKTPGALADLRKAVQSGAFGMDDLQAKTGLSELALKLFTKQVQETTKAINESDVAKLGKQLSELEKDLRGAEAAGLSETAILNRFGNQLAKITVDAAAAGVAIPRMVDKWSSALSRADIGKALDKLSKATNELGKGQSADFLKEMVRQADILVDRTNKAFASLVKAHDAYEDAVARRTLTATEFRIRELERQEQAEIDAIQVNGPLRAKAEAEIRRLYEDRTDAIIHAGVREAEATRLNLKDQLLAAEQTYQDMVESHAFTTREIEHQQEELRVAVKSIQEAFGDDWKAVLTQMGIDWKKLGKDIDQSWIRTLGDKLKGALSNIATDIPNIITDALIHGTKLEDAAAAVGTSIGSNIGGAIGFAIGGPLGESIGKTLGSLLGPLLKKLIKSDAERAAEELGKQWGITISAQMGEQIEETMKTKFKDMKNNRWLSEVFHLGDIIADVGGITIKNIDSLQKQLRQAFVFLDEGAFDVSDVQHVLDTSFNQFVEFFTSRNKILSKELVEIIRLNHQLGVESKAVLDFVAQQSGRAGSALLTVFNQTGSAFAGLGQKIAAAEEAVAEARKKGSSSDIVKANAELTRLLTEQHRGAEQLGAEVNRLGGFILATFNAGIASGLSFQQALAGVQEPLKRLIDLQKDLGLSENNPALKALEVASQVASSQAGQAAAATNELILALSNIGGLTSETFKGVEEQLKDVYLRVQSQVAKAGGGTKEALQQVLPSLQSIIDASKEYGFEIDDNTQALIDQAVALGLLTGEAAEKIPDAAHGIQELSDVLLVGFGALIEAVGGQLPAAFVTLRDKALESLGQINQGVEGLPDKIEIPVDFPRGELPTVPPTDLPDHVEIPIDFPVPTDVALPRFPTDISIPVAFDGLDEAKEKLEALGPAGAAAFDAIQAALAKLAAGAPGAADQLHAAFQQAFEALPPEVQAELQKIDDKIQLLASQNPPFALLGSIQELAESGVAAIGTVGTAINELPGNITIPIDFPTTDVTLPTLPDGIDIPIAFLPPDTKPIEDNAGDIERVYRHAWDEVRAGGVEASDEVRDAWLKGHLTIPDDIDDRYTHCWGDVRAGGIEASDAVMAAWIADQAEAAGQIPEPYRHAWGTISDEGVAMSEDVADAIRSIPEGMPEVRDRIIEAMKRAGTVASGKDGIGRIADALKDLPDLARDAASDIEDRLGDIDVPDIRVPIRWEVPEGIPQPPTGRTLASGGPVYAATGMFVPRGTDTVPAMLTPGEFVVNRDAVSRIGMDNLNALNRGETATAAPITVSVTNHFTIQAWDGEDVRRVLKSDTGIQKAIGDAAMKGIAKGGWGGSRFDERVRSVK